MCGLRGALGETATSGANTYFQFDFGSWLSMKIYIQWLYRFKKIIHVYNIFSSTV